MSADRSPGEPSRDTKKAADVLVEGLGGLLRAQLSGAEKAACCGGHHLASFFGVRG